MGRGKAMSLDEVLAYASSEEPQLTCRGKTNGVMPCKRPALLLESPLSTQGPPGGKSDKNSWELPGDHFRARRDQLAAGRQGTDTGQSCIVGAARG